MGAAPGNMPKLVDDMAIEPLTEAGHKIKKMRQRAAEPDALLLRAYKVGQTSNGGY